MSNFSRHAEEFVDNCLNDLGALLEERINSTYTHLRDVILIKTISPTSRGIYQLEDALSFFALGDYEDGEADYDLWEQVMGLAAKVEYYLNVRYAEQLAGVGRLWIGWDDVQHDFGLYLTVE